jgi:hypothetical protein
MSTIARARARACRRDLRAITAAHAMRIARALQRAATLATNGVAAPRAPQNIGGARPMRV